MTGQKPAERVRATGAGVSVVRTTYRLAGANTAAFRSSNHRCAEASHDSGEPPAGTRSAARGAASGPYWARTSDLRLVEPSSTARVARISRIYAHSRLQDAHRTA